MNITWGAETIPVAHFCVQMLNDFVTGKTYAQRIDIIRNFCEEGAEITNVNPGSSAPIYSVITSVNRTIILIGGATNAEMVEQIQLGYGRGRTQRPKPYNDFYTDTAKAMASNILVTMGIQLRPRLYVVGYSAGGAVAMALAADFKQFGYEGIDSVITFGSPKPGDERVEQDLLGIDVCRWMNEGDNICFCVPTAEQAPTMYFLNDFRRRQAFMEFQQTGLGKLMDNLGGVRESMLPSFPGRFTEFSIIAFMVSDYSDVATAHRLSLYVARLVSLYSNLDPVVVQVPVGVGIGRHGPQEHGRVAGAAANDQQLIELGAIPERNVAAPTQGAGPYYWQLQNGVPTVFSGELAFAVTRTKKSARDLAKSLNSSWRKWNRTVATDTASFVETVGDNFLS